jgi:hypothetical protein
MAEDKKSSILSRYNMTFGAAILQKLDRAVGKKLGSAICDGPDMPAARCLTILIYLNF